MTKGLFDFKKYLPFVDITSVKQQNDHVSNFSSTVNSFYMNNIWELRKIGFQSPNITPYNSPVSYKLKSFNNDIVYDNKQLFHSDHHLKSTLSTSQSISDQEYQTEWNNWAPYNIPGLENVMDVMRTSSEDTNEGQEMDTHNLKYLSDTNKYLNKFDNKSEQYLLNEGMRTKFLNSPYNFYRQSAKTNPQVVYHPVEKTASRFYEKNGSKERPLVDYKNGKMVFVKKHRKGSIYSFTENLDKFQKYQNIEYRNIDKNIEDSVNDMGKSYFKKSNTAHLSITQRNDKWVEYNEEEGIDKTSTQFMEKDVTNDKMFYNFRWNNKNEEPNKYSEIEDELNLISTFEPFHNTNSSNFRDMINVDILMPRFHNKILSEKSRIESQEDKSVTALSDKFIHNYQNEKLLTNEISYENDNQVSLSPSNPEIYRKYNSKISKNRINASPQFVNYSVPEVINDIDHNKNKLSSLQRSLVKIIHKNPELLEPQFDRMPFKTDFINIDNTNLTKNQMFSRLLLKINDFLHKLITDNYIKKRSIAETTLNLNKDKIQFANFEPKNKKELIFQFDIPTSKIFFNHKSHHNNIEKHTNSIKRSSSLSVDNKQCNQNIDKIKHYKFSGNWKNNMQSLIDKKNEKRNIQYDIYDEAVQTDPRKLTYFALNNNLQHLEIPHKPLEKFFENEISREIRSLNGIHRNNEKKLFFTDNRRKIKRNILGNKKMKSHELQFILEKNLPRLPLNKEQFITYMMTGMKKSRYPLKSEDEMHSHLSKKYLQSFIDRNSRKDKIVIESSNKRPKKKEWQNKW